MKNKALVSTVFGFVLLAGGMGNMAFAQQMQFMTFKTCNSIYFPNNNINDDLSKFKKADWGFKSNGEGMLHISLNTPTDSKVTIYFQQTELSRYGITARSVRCSVSQ